MVRIQIQLMEEQHRQLKRWAARLGISFAEAVRRCITDRLMAEKAVSNRKALIRDALEILGKYEDPEGLSGVAIDHDRHLSEAFRQ
jgi:hypothetical protein